MYEWLDEALDGSGCVLTASRRLARTLTGVYNERQRSRGREAWPTPRIRHWAGWLEDLPDADVGAGQGPARIRPSQSRVIWERSLSRELEDPLLDRGNFIGEVRETWERLLEWRVPLADCERLARSRDHHVFVRAARRYARMLEENGWQDGAQSRVAALDAIRSRAVPLPPAIWLAGFDRRTPLLDELAGALQAAGTRVASPPRQRKPRLGAVREFESPEAEMRAVGGWARDLLTRNPAANIGIVVPNLEREPLRLARLVQEGLVPWWQSGGRNLARAVNVSLGRRLPDYPAIAVALTLLDWLHRDLSSAEVSLLLCSPLLGAGDTGARCRLDAEFRRRPWQQWSPDRLAAALRSQLQEPGLAGWEAALAALAAHRARAPLSDSPAAWAASLDMVLGNFAWPGGRGLDSEGFQLVNRWRDLLNELAQLQLVTGRISLADCCRRLRMIAADGVFQPEATRSAVELLGPLEAAGLEFDHLWVAGMTATAWPPPARPLALVARELQRQRNMPDADPEDTLEYGRRVLDRLAASAGEVVASYPRQREDAEQTLSGLIRAFGCVPEPGLPDPGWGAGRRMSRPGIEESEDPVPPVGADETVSGGAATIQRQLVEPFSAFVLGRLGVRPLTRLAPGLRPWFRGNLVHDALRRLYADRPDSKAIAGWMASAVAERTREAARQACQVPRRFADPLLARLLDLEAARIATLLGRVAAVDAGRGEFTIDAVELPVEIALSGVPLRFRIDRVDRLTGGGCQVWDYKTGRSRRFLGRDAEPDDYQLVVYACALGDPVAGLGYYNVDSRAVSIDAAGEMTMPASDWETLLEDWRKTVTTAAAEIAAGDVRLNLAQPDTSLRPLAILSRYRELDRDG